MKKYLSIFLILFAIMATGTGCENNNPDNRGVEQWDAIENQAFLNAWYVHHFDEQNFTQYFFSHSAWCSEGVKTPENANIVFTDDPDYLEWKSRGNEITIFHKDGTEYKKAVYNPDDDTIIVNGDVYEKEH